jgi:putative transposase
MRSPTTGGIGDTGTCSRIGTRPSWSRRTPASGSSCATSTSTPSGPTSCQTPPHLDRYPWCGHVGILGQGPRLWHDRPYVLAWFGPTERAAVRAYRAFLRDGVPQGHRPELVGGGLIRSLGGWAEVRALRQRTDRVLADARILGSGAFVERLLAAGNERQQTQHARGHRLQAAQAIIRRQCQRERISPEELRLGSRRRRIAALRSQLAVPLVTQLGLSLADAARCLGVLTSGIAKTVARAAEQ